LSRGFENIQNCFQTPGEILLPGALSTLTLGVPIERLFVIPAVFQPESRDALGWIPANGLPE
jgi:hypothetical protein